MKRNIIFISIILVLGLLLGVQRCSYKNKLDLKTDELAVLKSDKQELEKIVNKQGDTITTQKAIIVSTQDAITNLSAEKFDLKTKNERLTRKVLSYSSQVTETKIDSVLVPFEDTISRKRFSDSVEKACATVIQFMRDSTIEVPKTATDSTSEYVASLTATKQGIKVNTLSVPDSIYSRIIEKKGGFFRKVMSTNKKGITKPRLKFYVPRSVEFQTLHTNKLVHVKGQTSIFYKPSQRAEIITKGAIITGTILAAHLILNE